jgi:hypothetical protein
MTINSTSTGAGIRLIGIDRFLWPELVVLRTEDHSVVALGVGDSPDDAAIALAEFLLPPST